MHQAKKQHKQGVPRERESERARERERERGRERARKMPEAKQARAVVLVRRQERDTAPAAATRHSRALFVLGLVFAIDAELSSGVPLSFRSGIAAVAIAATAATARTSVFRIFTLTQQSPIRVWTLARAEN
jgi:hypothetical protein